MASRPRPYRRLLDLSWRRRLLLLEAIVWLGFARLALALVPFRRLARRLAAPLRGSPDAAVRGPVLANVSWAIQTGGNHVPWQSRCLVQAIAGQAMLRLRRIPSTLVLGVSKSRPAGLEAHAWLRCGDTILTGGPAREGFTPLARFAEES